MGKKRILGLILAVVMMLVAMPIQTTQAGVAKISKKKATMEVDSILTLKVSGASSKVSWKSSDKKVAKVTSKGKVTALKEGTATITATVKSARYTCEITVINSNKDLSDTDFETPEPTPVPEPQKKIITVDITPDNWLDYFELALVEDWRYNAFGELDSFTIEHRVVLKDEYAKRLAEDSNIKYEVSFILSDVVASVDANNKTYMIYDSTFQTANRSKSSINEKIISSKENMGLSLARLHVSRWDPVDSSMRFWVDNITMKRIEGILYLYEE